MSSLKVIINLKICSQYRSINMFYTKYEKLDMICTVWLNEGVQENV